MMCPVDSDRKEARVATSVPGVVASRIKTKQKTHPEINTDII